MSLVDATSAMPSVGPGGGGTGTRDELKTQFMTREGLYKLMTLSEYSRPNRVGYANTAANPGAPVRVSFALPSGTCVGSPPSSSGPSTSTSLSAASSKVGIANGSAAGSTPTASGGSSEEKSEVQQHTVWSGEKIAFNYGREIFVYPYRGVKKAADLTKPIDKRIYKGTSPTCHDFGAITGENSDVIPLLIGFTGGQIQLVDPVKKELSKLYNEEVSGWLDARYIRSEYIHNTYIVLDRGRVECRSSSSVN